MSLPSVGSGARRSRAPGEASGRPQHRGNRYSRSEAARHAVLEAADNLLAELGYERLTMEGISAAAGVSKQTVYRWWRSKSEILLDAYLQDLDQETLIVGGEISASAAGYLRGLADFLTGNDAGVVLRALLAESEHDLALRDRIRRELLPRQAVRDQAVLARAVEQDGALFKIPLAKLAQALVAPIYYQALVARERMSDDEIAAHVDMVLDRHVVPSAGEAVSE